MHPVRVQGVAPVRPESSGRAVRLAHPETSGGPLVLLNLKKDIVRGVAQSG
ncbi:MAG: hypothetical protein O2887_05485 [Bacteroidetes bacterium]|nr:hypothetical protein [Bacteroidota bacterium]MDA1119933.1 hypothetical protein [Bacteroidota bacterium]